MTSAFDRTRRWLAEFGDPDMLATTLARTRVEIILAHPHSDAEISAAMTATLLLRLDRAAPIIHIVAPGTRSRPLPRLSDAPLVEALAVEHTGFNSVARLTTTPSGPSVIRLVFGGEHSDAVAVASRGWQVAVGTTLDHPAGNPIAASYAGVLGAVEAVKAMMASAGIQHRSLRPWRGVVSLWDYALPGVTGPALLDPLDLDDVSFVGCGGIASASAWVLGLFDLTGAPRVVDGDHLDGPNLNRHLTAAQPEAAEEMRKVDAFAALLDDAGASTVMEFSRWQELATPDRRRIELVAITVDDDPTRRDVQLDLPRLILNAGNADTGLYRVTRHNFLDGACLRCISRGDRRSHGPEESAARRLGLTLGDIQPLLATNLPLPEELLARATITQEERARIRGLSARQALGVVCGRFSPLPEVPALSMPPLSAAPGVLLAGEIVKSSLGVVLAPPLDGDRNVVSAGILSGPHDRWLSGRVKQPGCECGDDAYREAYRRTWPSATTA